jgi:hypothetical protein
MKELESLVGLGKKVISGARKIGYAAVASAALVGISGSASAEGCLEIKSVVGSYNIANSFFAQQVDGASYPNVVDSKDSFDSVLILPFRGDYTSTFSTIPSYNLDTDTRRSDSNTSFNIITLINANLPVSNETHLELGFPYGDGWKFENKSYLTLRETNNSGVPTGKVWDVFDVIAKGGVINTPNLPANNYSNSITGCYSLDFQPFIVPEPSTFTLAAIGASTLGLYTLFRRGKNNKNEYEPKSG